MGVVGLGEVNLECGFEVNLELLALALVNLELEWEWEVDVDVDMDMEWEVEADAAEEEDAMLRMDGARSGGGGGGADRRALAVGGETGAAVGRAGSLGGCGCFRRAMAFSQSCEMRATVVGLARAADADNSSKESASLSWLPVVC